MGEYGLPGVWVKRVSTVDKNFEIPGTVIRLEGRGILPYPDTYSLPIKNSTSQSFVRTEWNYTSLNMSRQTRGPVTDLKDYPICCQL